jgi:hypothetical protein
MSLSAAAVSLKINGSTGDALDSSPEDICIERFLDIGNGGNYVLPTTVTLRWSYLSVGESGTL